MTVGDSPGWCIQLEISMPIDGPRTPLNILKEIEEWKLEGADEDSHRYFFHIDEIRALENGDKTYVIGRKGTGKTALCKYFETNESYDRFCVKLSFKEFPFNLLYKMSDKNYTRPSQYISLWKYFIYNSILKMMATNAKVDSETRNRLSELYPPDSIDYMSSIMQKWTKKSTGIAIFGLSGQNSQDRQFSDIEEIWQDLIPAMEQIILQYGDDSKYFVVFDELDEDYRNYWAEETQDQYIALITSLFKATSNVRRIFSLAKANVYPIVFLRDDIYELLSDPDKNKWEDQKISLNWKREKIKALIGFRIARSFDPSAADFSFERNFDRIMQHETVRTLKKEVDVFDFIYGLTHSRPRDFVRYLRECAKSSREQGHRYITRDTIRGIDAEYSNHMRQELINEINGILPDINQIFVKIGATHNQRFPSQKFFEIIDEHLHSAEASPHSKALGMTGVIRVLFHFSVVGNAPRGMGSRPVYKYQREYLKVNPNEPFVVHRGLLRTLGLT
jgi:hypothetical protein